MTHGSLFSGIGSFDLAASWMGWENKFHCEWNEFGQKILKYYWPKAVSYGDITKTDFTIWRGRIDVLTGGFPCQPYSTAGKRLGKEDERHLWPEMLRAIREISPSWVVGENVRGLTNWNGGLVFDEVQADLEAIGYEVTPFLLPACGVNAPHKRDRIWFVAFKDTNKNGWGSNIREVKSNTWKFGNFSTGNNEQLQSDNGKTLSDTTNTGIKSLQRETKCNDRSESTTNANGRKWDAKCFETCSEQQNKRKIGIQNCRFNVTDSNGFRLWRKSNRVRNSEFVDENCKRTDWSNFPTESPICFGDDGVSSGLDGITFSKWRQESIKGGGMQLCHIYHFKFLKPLKLMKILFQTKKYNHVRNKNKPHQIARFMYPDNARPVGSRKALYHYSAR